MGNIKGWQNDWQAGVEYPKWGDNEVYKKTIGGGYLYNGENPKQAYGRVCEAVAKRLGRPEMADTFFEYIWNGWLCLASPVLANTGTERALPISCYGIDVADSIIDIGQKNLEMMLLAKHGGGVGIGINQIRPAGSNITMNGTSDGVVPFCKIFDSTILATNQGGVRKGAASVNLNIEHSDFDEWIEIREPKGDINRQSLNIHQCAVVGDKFMRKLEAGDAVARSKWSKLLQKRKATGEPYIMFKGNVNKSNPPAYKDHSLKVHMTNICCLPGDTRVVTKEGPKNISELVGKTVEIFDGENWVTNSSFEEKGYDNLYEIELSGGSKVRSTINHRWFVHENYNDIRRERLKEKTTSNLNVGDYIEFHKEEFHGSENIKGAYIKGFLLGDGTRALNSPKLALHNPKYSCKDTLIASLSEIEIDEHLRSDCIVTPGFSKEINNSGSGAWGGQLFENMQGLTARKSLINYVTNYKESFDISVWENWDRDSKLKFIAGLFDADGTSNGKYIQFTNFNPSVTSSIQMMLSSLGIYSSIDRGIRITINQNDSCDLIKCGFSRLKHEGEYSEYKTQQGFRKIISIRDTNKEELVYCPKVESTGKFALANGMMTGNSEIVLHTDENHSFVCCLSSLNLAKYDEWKDTNIIYDSIWFLDGVLEEFIQRAKYRKGFENSVRSAEKGRALGLGVLGWHTYLQEKGLPFEGLLSQYETRRIFSQIKIESERASMDLATTFGEPLWCIGTGMRNTHLRAIAPTVSNSKLGGNVSPGIEPWAANVFTDQSAKGTFIRKNPTLVKLFKKRKLDTKEIWDKILEDGGSVQGLKDLTDEEKEVFKTFKEINQLELVRQAGIRQQYIDQSVSLNLAFPSDTTPKWLNTVHFKAWKSGIKTLYYQRSESVLRGDIAVSVTSEDCLACDG